MKNAVVIIEEENVVEPMRRKTPGRKDSGKWQQTLHCTAKKNEKRKKACNEEYFENSCFPLCAAQVVIVYTIFNECVERPHA